VWGCAGYVEEVHVGGFYHCDGYVVIGVVFIGEVIVMIGIVFIGIAIAVIIIDDEGGEGYIGGEEGTDHDP